MPDVCELVIVYRSLTRLSCMPETGFGSFSVEFSPGPIQHRVTDRISPFIRTSGYTLPMEGRNLDLPQAGEYTYIILKTRVPAEEYSKPDSPSAINEAIAIMTTLFGRGLLGEELYRGYLWTERTPFTPGYSVLVSPDPVDCAELMNTLGQAVERIGGLPGDSRSVFSLMARFRAVAADQPFGPERLVSLWTILELVPGEGTIVGRVCRYLAGPTGCSPDQVKSRLRVPWLHKIRSRLLHAGIFTRDSESGRALEEITLIADEVLRTVMGFPYGHSLDKYLFTCALDHEATKEGE